MNRQIRRLFSRGALIMAIVVGSADSRTRVLAGHAAVPSRKTASDFTLIDSNDSPVRLSAYIGKVVLLDFWATWCTGCKVEIPWLWSSRRSTRIEDSSRSAWRWTLRAGHW